MAISVTVAPELDAILTKIARAGVRHPVDLSKKLRGDAIVLEFSMGGDDLTPTVNLSSIGTHEHPFVAEPERTFDDRELA